MLHISDKPHVKSPCFPGSTGISAWGVIVGHHTKLLLRSAFLWTFFLGSENRWSNKTSDLRGCNVWWDISMDDNYDIIWYTCKTQGNIMIWIVRSLGWFSLGMDLPAESGASQPSPSHSGMVVLLGRDSLIMASVEPVCCRTITGHDNLRRTEWDGIVPKMATFELCYFSDVGCYHFIGTYARLTFRVRAHNFSLRGSLGGDRLPTQAYAREVLCNF